MAWRSAFLQGGILLLVALFCSSFLATEAMKLPPAHEQQTDLARASGISRQIRTGAGKRGARHPRAEGVDCTLNCTSFSTERPIKVTVGAYITQISQVDPVGQNYFMSGYYWLYWPTCTQFPDDRFQPYDSVVIENQSAQWGLTLSTDLANSCTDSSGEEYTCPTCDAPEPGLSYVTFKFSANLKLSFDYKRYPLDEQELYIAFEDSDSEAETLILLPDPQTQYHETVNVVAFDVTGIITRTAINKQRTSYGYKNVPPSSYSRAELGITIYRDPIFFSLRVLPPALVTLGVSSAVLFIDPLNLEVRLTVAVTGLLTMVLMGLGFSDKIPDVADLTLNDWFFNWCYLILLLVVLECISISVYISRIPKILLHADLGMKLLDGLINEKWLNRKAKAKKAWTEMVGKKKRKKLVETLPDTLGDDSATPFTQFHNDTPGDDEDDEERMQEDKEKAKRFIHTRLRWAKRLDYILATIILLLSTIGSVLVIVLARFA